MSSIVSHFRHPVPEGQHELIVPDHTGHSTLTWEPGTRSEVEVKEAFDRIIAQGYSGYAQSATGELTVTRQFDATAARIVVSPPLVGG